MHVMLLPVAFTTAVQGLAVGLLISRNSRGYAGFGVWDDGEPDGKDNGQ